MQNQENLIYQICDEAINNLDFDNRYSDPYIVHKAKCVVKKVLAVLRLRDDYFSITWRTGLLAKALFSLDENDNFKDYNIKDYLIGYLDKYINKHGKIARLDNVQNGEVAVKLYKSLYNEKYLELINTYKGYIEDHSKDSEGAIPFLEGEDIYVDGLMICPFIFQYNSCIEKDIHLYEIGINHIKAFIKNGIDDRMSLPYHGYNLENRLQLGIPGWGRGTGWFLYSIIDSLQYFDDSDDSKKDIQNIFKKVVDAAIGYQHEDGLFNWFLLTPKGPIDTSATAMILYSIAKAINLAVLGPEYKVRVINGYRAMQKYIIDGKVYQAMGDCKGFSMYPQTYSSYPWSIAFYILLYTEIIKWNDEKL